MLCCQLLRSITNRTAEAGAESGGTRRRIMGNAQSPPVDPIFDASVRAFSNQELEDLRSLFASLAAHSGSDRKFISQSVFQDYFRVPGPLGARMFQLASRKRNDGMLTFEDLVVTKATYEKGGRDEIEEFIYQLCDVTGDGVLGSKVYINGFVKQLLGGRWIKVTLPIEKQEMQQKKVYLVLWSNSRSVLQLATKSDIESVLNSIYEAIFCTESDDVELSSHQDVLEVFTNAAIFSLKVQGEESMSLPDFRSWCSLVPSARKFLGSLLTPPDSGRPGSHVPHLLYPEDLSSDMLVLRKEYAWHIGGALPQNEVQDWKLLYHSAINGLSFSTFLGNISKNGDGPTVLIIKDTEGFIYGGYASQLWQRQGDFYGDMKSFLFQLFPKASIFRPTGANSNLQWCAVNFSSDSIPNGIGFGGRANHFGLFLSANFDQGQTFSCTTFNSPCLSKTSKIYPEVIECWGILEKGSENGKPEALKGTVLERFKEDRNMLKMVGLASSSD